MIAEPPERRRAGRTGRDAYQLARRKKLTADERRAVVLTAGNRTLRELAAEFGVSHETIRSVIRQATSQRDPVEHFAPALPDLVGEGRRPSLLRPTGQIGRSARE